MKINGQNYEAQIVEYNKYNAKIIVNGIDFLVEFGEDQDANTPVNFIPSSKTAVVEEKVIVPQPPDKTAIFDVVAPNPSASAIDKQIKAPLPGTVNDIKVSIGDTIAVNQVVVILEAMKMESEIYSDHSGMVKNILVNKGQNVHDGQVMIEIE